MIWFKHLIDKFYEAVNNHNAQEVSDLFCKDAIVLGRGSQKTRVNRKSIKEYFNFFANLEGIKILSKSYNIKKISNNAYVNNAIIKLHSNFSKNPIMARMTFVIKNNCIYLLHSSEIPKQLIFKNKSGKNVVL